MISAMRLPVVNDSHTSGAPVLEQGPRSMGSVRVLRISVTDRCNYRCVYCMPDDGVAWLPKEDLLTYEELADVVRASIEHHNIRRFKITGGEPTVRHGLVDFVAMLKRIPGVDDLSLTTNGQLMEDLAQPLREAGLDRVTISLDSLRADRFRQITRRGDLTAVLRGIDRTQDVGFNSVKINCVTMRGTNDDELVDFARLSIDRALTVRFIEYMPLGDAALLESGNPFQPVTHSDGHVTYAARVVASDEVGPAGGCGAQDRGNVFVPEAEVRQIIESQLGPLIPVAREIEAGVGPAVPYRLDMPSARGRIGFISAMSHPFCSTCNRLRLTATGTLRSCLFEGGEVETRGILRDSSPGNRAARIAQAMTDCVRHKPVVHSSHGHTAMSRMGG